MSPRKLLFLTVLVLVLFGFILLFERKMPTTAEREQKGDLVWDIPEDGLESVRLEHGGASVELKKTNGGWRLTKPEAYPTDPVAVSDVTSQLARLKRVGGESADARPEDYGFQSPSGRATLVAAAESKGGKRLTWSVEFGVEIPGTDTTAARVTGRPGIFFVPSSAANAAKKGAGEFKSKDVFGSMLEAARLDVDRGRGRVSLAKKNGVWWLNQPVTDLADADAVQRLVGDLTGLKALEFVPAAERQNLAALGLSPPLYRVVAMDPKGAGTAVDFGATRSDGNSVYARRENQVFTVSTSIVEDLSKEAVAFREPRLVRFDRGEATEVNGSFARESFSVSRKDARWTAGGRPLMSAAADDLVSALLDLKSRSFVDEEEASSLRSGRPLAAVTVKLSASQSWILKFYPRRGETEATVSERPGAFLLAGDAVSTLEAAFQKAVTSPAPTPAPTPKPRIAKR